MGFEKVIFLFQGKREGEGENSSKNTHHTSSNVVVSLPFDYA